MFESFVSQQKMPLGTGRLSLPDRKWSHWHVNTITVLLSPGELHSNLVREARQGEINGVTDERWMDIEGGVRSRVR